MSLKICVMGLGYVGLPLAIALDRAGHRVVGYDISTPRLKQLSQFFDATNELTADELRASGMTFTGDAGKIREAEVVIVTVPTPVTDDKVPDLRPLESACELIGKNLGPGATIVFESTVYPGVTEDHCGPIIAKVSGLAWRKDFFLGYSPERINPGDKTHTIDKIVKVISGDTPRTVALLEKVYGPITRAGLHVAESIKVAEAAKVIENTQRDLNIALMNELSIIFEKLDIRTDAVLEAAGTKWNFLPFKPGLVGGHCIGVDPYYLTSCAEKLGYHPEVILAGRRVNDAASRRVADKALELLAAAGIEPANAKVAILGLTFKENVPDIRNSLVFDIISRLRGAGVSIAVYDPVVDQSTDFSSYGFTLTGIDAAIEGAEVVVAAVAHDSFAEDDIVGRLPQKVFFLDIKSRFPQLRSRSGVTYWAL